MGKVHITSALVSDAAHPTGGASKYRIRDISISGFFCEVRPTGHKTYWLQYTDPRGRRRDYKIGHHGDISTVQARKRASELRAAVTLGADPAGERDRRRAVLSVQAFVDERFMPYVRTTIRSHAEYECVLRLRILPAIGRLALDEVTFAHVAALRRKLIAEGLSAGRVNQHLAVVRRVFNLALKWDTYQGRNPAQSPGMLREEPREVFIDEVQLRSLMRALAQDADQSAASAIALLALTGARKSEILLAKWENVDLDRGLLTVPVSKNGRRRHIVLSAVATAILRSLPRLAGNGFVFPSHRVLGKPIRGVRAVWRRCKAAAALPPELRLHDLRHTFASLCVASGVPIYDVSKLLGHRSPSTTARYAHLRDEKLLETANVVGSLASGFLEAS